MTFTIDPSAPTVPESSGMDRIEIPNAALEGAQEICSSIQDNDSEIWSLTLAGQFIRRTGVDGDRYFVVSKTEAFEFLDGFASEEIMDELRAAGAFEGAPAPKA